MVCDIGLKDLQAKFDQRYNKTKLSFLTGWPVETQDAPFRRCSSVAFSYHATGLGQNDTTGWQFTY